MEEAIPCFGVGHGIKLKCSSLLGKFFCPFITLKLARTARLSFQLYKRHIRIDNFIVHGIAIVLTTDLCLGPALDMRQQSSSLDAINKIATIFGIRDQPEEELYIIRSRTMDGTGQWITQRAEYLRWMERNDEPQKFKTFWLVGLPGTGKTVLTSVVIDHLRLLGQNCAYHFFSTGHQAKRTEACCLRSIAAQLAWTNQEFRDRVIALHEDSGITFTAQSQNSQILWDRIFKGIICKMRFAAPLFWVLDAVDEADAPALIISHFVNFHSTTPIKIFFSSRPMRISLTGCDTHATTYVLSEKDTVADIRSYVQNALEIALPDNKDIRKDIAGQLLANASGSFLWIKLTVETLEDNWHTEDDIRKALRDVPKGMEDLYRRMLDNIESQPPRALCMAKSILTWAACSWRPLNLAELEVALEPEFKGFVNLKNSIVQICGHFVSVDSSAVSIIHATARQYLLSEHNGSPAFIVPQNSHEHIVIVCLQYMSSNDWLGVSQSIEKHNPTVANSSRKDHLLMAQQGHPLLGYSIRHWAYHVSKSDFGSNTLAKSITGFLSQYCLSWIEAIALSTNLRYITRSAQYLKNYAKLRFKQARKPGSDAPLNLEEPPKDDTKVIQRWANDLIRLVTKFGMCLVKDPSSIHRQIPSFCPRGSMIGGVYGTPSRGKISVAGLSSDKWGDCLASVSVQENRIASQVLTVHESFLTLIKSIGIVVVWNSETCEEERRLQHHEYISHVVANRSGDLLATAGTKTYRVWDIASGKELYMLPIQSAASTMAIAIDDSDTELIVASDDCSIVGMDLVTSQETWRCIEEDQGILDRCPSTMAFSPDLTKIAVAWRSRPPSVWDFSTKVGVVPQLCSFQSASGAVCGPESLAWQKGGNSLLVLCQSAVIVRWDLYEDKQTQFDHISAKEMAVSQNGNLMLTSDYASTISIWTLPRADLIYRLINQNGIIRSLAFSPDAQRFYDTRGSLCHVWEPDVLVLPDGVDATGVSSVGENSALTEPVVTEDLSSRTQVTSLAADVKDMYYCCGNDDGTVFIHNIEDGKRLRKVYAHDSFTFVVLLAWSRSGKYMVSGDETSRILAKRLESKGADAWAVYSVFDVRLPESAQQFLFSNDEKYLLVSTSSMDLVYDLKAKRELHRHRWGFRQSRRWIEHPSIPESLIRIDIDAVHVYRWTSLQDGPCTAPSEKTKGEPGTPSTPFEASYQTQLPKRESSKARLVQWIALTRDRRYLVYAVLPDTGHTSGRSSQGPHLEFLSNTNLGLQHPHGLTSDGMADLAGQIKRLIGTYRDSIIFLDHNYWLCSWEIGAPLDDIKRHFFFPRTGSIQACSKWRH